MALAHSGSGVLGLDLAGDEALFDASRFERHFTRARSRGLGITVHAGEGRDPSHVRDAVEILGADRIGHGVAAASDGEVLDLLAERQTVVECCISSNVHTGAVSSVSEHPLPVFLREGVRAVLATDNRFFSGTTLSREYELAGRELSLSREELAALSVESGRASFLPPGDRESLTGLLHENAEAELGTSKEGDLPT
jgi:adenosine deaminase